MNKEQNLTLLVIARSPSAGGDARPPRLCRMHVGQVAIYNLYMIIPEIASLLRLTHNDSLEKNLRGFKVK